jgi:hypothetical protein
MMKKSDFTDENLYNENNVIEKRTLAYYGLDYSHVSSVPES